MVQRPSTIASARPMQLGQLEAPLQPRSFSGLPPLAARTSMVSDIPRARRRMQRGGATFGSRYPGSTPLAAAPLWLRPSPSDAAVCSGVGGHFRIALPGSTPLAAAPPTGSGIPRGLCRRMQRKGGATFGSRFQVRPGGYQQSAMASGLPKLTAVCRGVRQIIRIVALPGSAPAAIS